MPTSRRRKTSGFSSEEQTEVTEQTVIEEPTEVVEPPKLEEKPLLPSIQPPAEIPQKFFGVEPEPAPEPPKKVQSAPLMQPPKRHPRNVPRFSKHK